MSLIDQLKKDSEAALRSGDILKTETLRGLLAALHNKEIELRGKGGKSVLPADRLDEEEVIAVLGKEAKKRKEANQIYAGAGRTDLADKELKELTFINAYLPPELGADEIEVIVRKVVHEGVRDFGQVMRGVLKETRGRAEPGTVKEIVERVLELENRK
ncbi:MAG: GatB/YqeY domain-containing protein [Candidatus Colwellbacteria bacterium]|nr:GatB/YqeY domain-containing protein [Candidatus Colwellbacteria bacterium]